MNIQSVSVWQTVKAAVFSVLIGVVLCFLFAVVRYFFPFSNTVTLAVVQTLKAISLLLGCFFCLSGEGGWWKGLITGAIFCTLSFLVFSSIGGGGLSLLALVDVLVCLVTGGLGGIAAVNIKRG